MRDRLKTRLFLLALCCLAALSVGIFALRGLANLAAGGAPPPNASILPADHGLPDTIAGYPILAVKTSETTACIASGVVRLMVQVDASNALEARLLDTSAIHEELKRLFPNSAVIWELELVSSEISAVRIAAGNAEWNALFAERGCFVSQPIPTFLPTPPSLPP